MDYYLIKGKFYAVGYSPDGDSLMFKADNDKHWDKIKTEHRKEFEERLSEKDGAVQLRLQGVDALETHYSPSPLPPPRAVSGQNAAQAEQPEKGKFRQPAEYGDLATAKMLELFGVDPDSIKWRTSGWSGAYIDELTIKKGNWSKSCKDKHDDALDGYVVVNDMDRKGRPISWVFAGNTGTRNGSRLTTGELAQILDQSANYKLLAQGLVYPYFFFTLEAKLRDLLMGAVENARRQKMNIWSADKSDQGVWVRKFSELVKQDLIFPYLFRRLVKHQYKRLMEGYWEALQKQSRYTPDTDDLFLESFFDDTNPYVFLIDERNFKRLDEVVHVTKTKIQMKTHPGNIVFLG